MPSLSFRLLLGALLAVCVRLAAAAVPALVLDEHADRIDVWPAVTVLAEEPASVPLAVDDVLRRRGGFVVPRVPRANFGQRDEALWLRVPLAVAQAGRWVLDIDYAPLNRIDLYVVDGDRVVRQFRLGNDQPYESRPLKSRGHAVMLEFGAAGTPELLLRVQTATSMLVPMTLYQPSEFLAEESAQHLLQGLLHGLALMLLAYSVAHAVSLRDRLFAYYALLLLGLTVFFVSYTGIGQQYLWSVHGGWIEKIAPQGALVAVIGGSLFSGCAIDLGRRHPRVALALWAVAGAAGGALALSLLGLLDYRATQRTASLLGPLTLVVVLPPTIVAAWRGDRTARLLVLGWSIYTVGAISIAGMLRGFVPYDGWTRHLFQLSSMFEMLVWLRLLGVRVQDVRREAERAQLERQALHSLAHTDALTGLLNRRGLNEALAAALPACRADHALAVYLLDLDGFKPVNDRYGHDVGDTLLVQVGVRLRSQLRASDVVARVGGDEFVVVSGGLGNEGDAMRLGTKLLDAFREPFVVDGQHCEVGLTIGYALAPHDGSGGGDLLKRADAAMYAGKQAGRRCVRRGAASPGLVTG